MPLSKKKRERLWQGYVLGMAIFYALTFGVVTLVWGPAVGFLASFASLFISMIGFLALMRRLGGSAPPRQSS